ncbi:MAG: MFS transporter, partial [Leptothrix sp. (in: b-proteobacteria)]
AEGAYFGWWNGATKLNLALSAGLALPVLQWAGYHPGSRDAPALLALSVAYALLPCGLKGLAGLALWRAAPWLPGRDATLPPFLSTPVDRPAAAATGDRTDSSNPTESAA